MGKINSPVKDLRICVARGKSQDGRPWSLWWPSHKWAELPTAEQTAVIERQAAAQRVTVCWRLGATVA